MQNEDIVELFREMADLLELEDANPYRVRAYRNAAVTIEGLSRPVSDLIDEGADLTELRGIGEDLAGALREMVSAGQFSELDKLRGTSTGTLRELLRIPGLGPKRVQTLHDELGIETLADLQAALESGEVEQVSGFGAKTVENLRETLLAGRRKKERQLWADVEDEAAALESFVQGLEGVEQARVGGSFRRKRETVADLDAVASSHSAADVIERFVGYEQIASVVSQGTTRASVLLKSGLPVDLRVVAPESWGTALMYFTGSRDHQILLRDIALIRDWKLNEYGLFDGDERLAGATEEEVYRAYGMAWIPPELRENRGEIEAARAGNLPEMITLDDIRGDLHLCPGGPDSIEALAVAAMERGYAYIAVADRITRDGADGTLDIEQLRAQIDEVARLNDEMDGLTILCGAEIEVLEDGSLALDDDLIADLDIVYCSLDNHHDLSRENQTARVLRAIEHPHCMVLGHLAGRIVGEREPRDVDFPRVLEAAKDAGCAIELDANPHRLDLPDRYFQMAREIGVQLTISSRAARPADLDRLRFGVDHARRGWVEAEDALNTRTLKQVRSALRSS